MRAAPRVKASLPTASSRRPTTSTSTAASRAQSSSTFSLVKANKYNQITAKSTQKSCYNSNTSSKQNNSNSSSLFSSPSFKSSSTSIKHVTLPRYSGMRFFAKDAKDAAKDAKKDQGKDAKKDQAAPAKSDAAAASTPVEAPAAPSTPIFGVDVIPPHILKLADQMLALNIVEMGLLSEAFRQKLGVSNEDFFSLVNPGVVVASGGAAAAAGAAAPAPEKKEEKKEERTAWNLKLTKIDEASKFKILKEIRNLSPGMNLAETKALTDKLPSILKQGLGKEEAQKWIATFKEIGAIVELD